MSTKKLKKADLSISVLLIIGILAVVNFFSYQIFHRFDLTQNKIYSISDVSKKTVGELDDIVNIKAYFSDNLPSQVLSIKQEVADVLDEYAAFSNGNIKVEFIDPRDDEKIERELMMIGIPRLTFEIYEKDKLQMVNGYMGVSISHGDNTEVIPAVKRNTSDLEYQITTAIKKVTTEEIAMVGILTSHGATTLEQGGMSFAHKELREIYTVLPIELTEENAGINPGINTLVIVGPKEPFNESQLRAINSFLMRGGSLMLLLDGVTVGQGLIASKNSTGLEGLFSKYGIKLNQDLIADTRSGVASFSQGFVTFSSNYPFWPKATSDGFNKKHSAVSNLESVVLPWASSIEIDENLISAEHYSGLIFTTDNSWRVQDNFNIAPNTGMTSQTGAMGSYNLAVNINGMLTNAYPDEGGKEKFNGRIIIVGDSDFISDNFLRQNPDNLILFQNLVDSLSFDEDLINIRSKGVSSRPIKEGLSDGSRSAIRYFNVFGLTVAVIIFGMVRYYMRQRSRFVDDL